MKNDQQFSGLILITTLSLIMSGYLYIILFVFGLPIVISSIMWIFDAIKNIHKSIESYANILKKTAF